MTLLLLRMCELTRWTTSGLLTLLFAFVCACDDGSERTALRFLVYSDAKLSRVQVSVLGAPPQDAGQFAQNFGLDVASIARVDEPLLTIQVEVTEHSQNRTQAVLRLDGYDSESKLVLSQTVRANFTDKQTRFVRIWLARSCTNPDAMTCPSEMSCAIVSRRCEPQPTLVTLDESDIHGKERWVPDGYTPCGVHGEATDGRDGICPSYCDQQDDKDCGCSAPCKYGACEQSACKTPERVPAPIDYTPREPAGLSTTYVRRVLNPARTVVAVGGEFKGEGGVARFFVAEDADMTPGKVLAVGTQTVSAATEGVSPDGFIRAEYVF
ncbi:MAG TPA: hypothetical protein VI299_27655, partial [Polyangiales bacterium]